MGRWMAIKHKKASADAKKGVALARYSREVMRAAQLGGPDPSGNFRLRTAIDKAKAGGLTKDAIEKAILKGSGQLQGEKLEDLSYEGYGPSGVAIFIEASTDNRNRTAGDIRSYFNKNDGNLGQDGSVAFLFEPQGLLEVPLAAGEELQLWEWAAEVGADEVLFCDEKQVWQLVCPPADVYAVAEALMPFLPDALHGSVEMIQHRVPTTSVAVTDAAVAKPLLKLLQALEAHDDVETVYCNADIDEALLEQFS